MLKKSSFISFVLISQTFACSVGKVHRDSDGDQDGQAAESPIQNASTGYAMPSISSQNSTTCGGVSTIDGSNIGAKFCGVRAQVSSLGPSIYLSTDNAANMSADTLQFDLWSFVSPPENLKENTAYELTYKRNAQDGRLETAPDAKVIAAAAFRPQGDVFKQVQLKGFVMFSKLPRKTGDAFDVKFDMQSVDGLQSIKGEASGAATDSPYMKPDNN